MQIAHQRQHPRHIRSHSEFGIEESQNLAIHIGLSKLLCLSRDLTGLVVKHDREFQSHEYFTHMHLTYADMHIRPFILAYILILSQNHHFYRRYSPSSLTPVTHLETSVTHSATFRLILSHSASRNLPVLTSAIPCSPSQVVHHDTAFGIPGRFCHLLPKRGAVGGVVCMACPYQNRVANHRRFFRIRGASHAPSTWEAVGGARITSWQCAYILGADMEGFCRSRASRG